MIPQEIIRKKRDKNELSKEEIYEFVKGVTDKNISNCQISALTMAIYLNGMTYQETADLTLAMRDSGEVLSWEDVDAPIVDKHSSGGVGDKVSLLLAPLVAACGVKVPMIAGRGLGHTGGTLDKLDSIPGYNTSASIDVFKKTVKEIGCAIIGQTGTLAPADKRIYAVRDITATVENIPLITASILSKKLAEGLSGLVMDLKFGNGAFMTSFEEAEALAKNIVNVANAAGTKTRALITDMNQVLGHTVGNSLEMLETVNFLRCNNVEERLGEVTFALAEEMLLLAGIAKDKAEASSKLDEALASGKAMEVAAKMIAALGGPSDFLDEPEKYLPKAKFIKEIYPKKEGFIKSMNARNIGMSMVFLGGQRKSPEQKIDYAVGYTDFCHIGDKIYKNTPIAFVHANDEETLKQASLVVQNAVEIVEDEVKKDDKIIYQTIE